MTEKKNIPIKAFQLACEELCIMHRNGIFLRDIKPDNMVMHGQHAKHIDIDSVYIEDVAGEIYAECYTANYITRGLRLVYNDSDSAHKAFRRIDNYTMLKTMMFATYIISTDLGLHLNDLRKIKIPDGMKIGKSILLWVEHHVKPGFRRDICNFLEDPAKSNPVHSLKYVINWNTPHWESPTLKMFRAKPINTF